MHRRAFTLVELLVVLLIVSVVAAVALPVVKSAWESQRVGSAAQLVQGAVVEAGARAQKDHVAGVRLLPDPTLLARRDDGSIDPARPLAYDRVVQLIQPPGSSEGLVAVYSEATGFPAAFANAVLPRRLVLEQERRRVDPGSGARLLNPPTSWAWRVRVGDKIELYGKMYAVAGPEALGPKEGNVERFVNYSASWPALDRGDGPAEWLYLSNMQDDDGDGRPDNGLNGLDDEPDGLVDEPDEWTETEVWIGLPPGDVRQATYTLRPRPAPSPTGGLVLAGAVVDATGWASTPRTRSRLPVDPWTGAADLLVDASGRWTPSRTAGVPSADGFAAPYWHLWIANREDVDAPASQGVDARLLTIDGSTGRVSVVEAVAADPGAAYAEAEGRSL